MKLVRIGEAKALARISHTPSAAACGRPAPSALRLVRVLDPLADLRARTGARLESAGLALRLAANSVRKAG